MKRKTAILIVLSVLLMFSLTGCLDHLSYNRQIGMAEMKLDPTYEIIEGDEAIAYAITHTLDSGYEIGEEAYVTKKDINEFKMKSGWIDTIAFYDVEDYWGRIDYYSTLYTSSELADYMVEHYGDFSFEYYDYIENDKGAEVFLGKTYNKYDTPFYYVATIDYGVAYVVTVHDNEELAKKIADSIELQPENMEWYSDSFEGITYSIPVSFRECEDNLGKSYKFISDDSVCSFELSRIDKADVPNVTFDSASEIVASLLEISDETVIDTELGPARCFTGMKDGRPAQAVCIEYDGSYYIIFVTGKTDILEEILESVN